MTTVRTEEQAYIESRDAEIGIGLRQLIQISGKNSRDHGFHDEWPGHREWKYMHPEDKRALQMAISEKLALVHEEISEMLGEIRSGHDPLEIYFVDKEGGRFGHQLYVDGVPQRKPEGFLVEAADAMIRLADLTYLVRGSDELVAARDLKHEYNATRPYKHGRAL